MNLAYRDIGHNLLRLVLINFGLSLVCTENQILQ
jgi:hypothetical protein